MSVLEQLIATRKAEADSLEAFLQSILDEKRNLTNEEELDFESKRDIVNKLDARIAELTLQERARQEADENLRKLGIDFVDLRVKSEPRVYDKGAGTSYFRDLWGERNGNAGAHDRLIRHARETEVIARENPNSIEARALSTTDGAGGYFVPPAWLVNKYVKFAREGRPFANQTNKQDMVKGTDVINLPKILTGTATGAQASGQNSGVPETDLTDGVVSSPVVTRSGQQTVSLQMLEQSPIPIDEALMEDLTGALAEDIDTLCLTAPGGSGMFSGVTVVTGSNAVTYTSTTPTGLGVYQAIVQGISQARRGRKRMPTAIFMTAARWFWLVSQADSNGRPLVVPSDQGVYNALAMMAANNEGDEPIETPVGTLLGLPVFIDDHIPTNLGTGVNQDEVVISRTSDLWLYESVPTFRNLPQTYGQNLSVLFQIYEYAAFLARHDKGISVVGGSGFTSPVGY